MARTQPKGGDRTTGEVVDFDDLLFDACPESEREDLLYEAQLLAAAFAPKARSADLRRMATQLSAGAHDAQMGRAHARRLAAALKHLARTA